MTKGLKVSEDLTRGDDGKLHCERYHYLRTRASATFDSVDEVIAWLRVNLPLIGKEAA